MLFCWLLLVANTVFSQNYQTGKTSITFTDASRNRQIATDIYYPANLRGTNVPPATGPERFPVVVFGHGFTLGTSNYAKLGDTLARYGYVAAFPSTETSFSPSHDNFGKDLSFLCTALINSDTIQGSFFYQKLVHKAAVGGHSMGGGCSFLAAGTQNPLIHALFNMAAAETNPSATAAALSVNVPTLIFSGSNDCIVPPSVQQNMYNNLSVDCKSVVNITGATHCQIADNNFNCTFGQISSGCNSSPITVTTVYDKVTASLIPFLDYHLKDNCYRGIDYVTVINSLAGITLQNTCSIPVCQILSSNSLNLYGKKSGDKAIINWETNNNADILLFDLEKSRDGLDFIVEASISKNLSGQYSYTDQLPISGQCYYRLKMTEKDNSKTYSKVIRISSEKELMSLLGYYPNPIQELLNLNIYSEIRSNINIVVVDGTGRIASQFKNTITPGSNTLHCNLKELPVGLYYLKITTESNRYQKMVKIIKN